MNVELVDGVAESMGGGTFIVVQADEHGVPQTVVLQEDDLRRMLGLTQS
jgi:hypothetical protein